MSTITEGPEAPYTHAVHPIAQEVSSPNARKFVKTVISSASDRLFVVSEDLPFGTYGGVVQFVDGVIDQTRTAKFYGEFGKSLFALEAFGLMIVDYSDFLREYGIDNEDLQRLMLINAADKDMNALLPEAKKEVNVYLAPFGHNQSLDVFDRYRKADNVWKRLQQRAEPINRGER